MCESTSDGSQVVARLASIQLSGGGRDHNRKSGEGPAAAAPHHHEMDTTSTSASASASDSHCTRKKKKKKKLNAKDKVVLFPAMGKSYKPLSLLNKKLSAFGKRNVAGCFCFKQPPTSLDLDSGTTSDPNHPNFNSHMLKLLIENNHFYSKDCNPHLS